jgi:minor extracellular serine protease Vpr
MPTRPRSDGHALALTLLAVAVTVALLAFSGQGTGHATPPAAPAAPSRWRGLVGARPRVTVGQRVIVVLKAPSLAQRVAAAGGRVGDQRERAWSNAALASQRLLISKLAIEGVTIRPEHTFTRVLNGFSAAVDPAAVPLLERDSDVAGVYPVRPAYPATISSEVLARSDFAPGAGHRADVGLAGVDGRGVTIALLDTGVDPATPYLRARVLQPGIDIVGGDRNALPARKPDDPGQLERHGTELAGLLVGAGGPSGLAGIATGATVLPIRVAGWQQDATGRWGLYGRSDQLIAGLERAVDPNDDGDAHDAARIALVGLAEPYAAFTDGPEARAVQGALALDTLVVAPAGNDGVAGPGFGSISGPGGAPGAVTVGAVDARRRIDTVHVLVRSGLRVLLDRRVPLAGAVRPARGLDLGIGVARGGLRPQTSAPSLARFFDRDGTSRVAGQAALVAGGAAPGPAAERAAEAGAGAVLLYGDRLAAGGLGLDAGVSVPAVSLPATTVHALLARLRAGATATVSIGQPRLAANEEAGRVASFSSAGLAFDGTVKPDLVAAGVGLATSDPGTDADGTPRFATLNGTSASAAVVAGAAALLAQARPALDAPQLGSLLVGTASPLAGTDVFAQGNGLLDVGAAAAGELAASPMTLSLGRSSGRGWRVRQAFLLQNVSTRSLRIKLSVDQTAEGAASVRFTLRPRRLLLRRGHAALVVVRARTLSTPAGVVPAQGAVVAAVDGGGDVRVPWTIAFGPPSANLIAHVRLQRPSFRPSDASPTLLTFDAGELLPAGGRQQVRPVARLDLELFNAIDDDLGLLARLRDLLPGSYGFGLTGRDPAGAVLPPGSYRLVLTAWPSDGGRPTRRQVKFTVRG